MDETLVPLSQTANDRLQAYETIIEAGLQTFVDVGAALLAIRDERLYHATHATFEAYCRERWDISRPRAYQLIEAAETVGHLSTIVDILPANEAQAHQGAGLEPEVKQAAWQEVVATAPGGKVTAAHVQATVTRLAVVPAPGPSKFNRTNEMVDWAKWTWNPVTGCLHDCGYCYSRPIAVRFYPQGFTPTFHPDRLQAPHVTPVPAQAATEPGYRRVFVCSMADLFGKWVPQEWIDAVMAEVRAAPQWTFLFLTKFPQRLETITWPANAWVGTTVDEQYRVSIAEKAFRNVQAPVKWLSCEPLRARLTFSSLTMFDWVVLGGQSQTNQAPAFQPPWE